MGTSEAVHFEMNDNLYHISNITEFLGLMNNGHLCRRGGLCAEKVFITGSTVQYIQ